MGAIALILIKTTDKYHNSIAVTELQMNRNGPGRIYQDDNFDVIGFEGLAIESLLGLVDFEEGADDDEPIVVNLKIEGQSWQQFFVEFFCGFWEDWGELIDEEDLDDGVKMVDYTQRYGLTGLKITAIACRDIRIMIDLEDVRQFRLELVDPEDEDTGSRVICA